VSLHKGTNLKGMLPKLKSSKYILVYRSSLRTFWYPLVQHSRTWSQLFVLHSISWCFVSGLHWKPNTCLQ
jgi:hypothetical protein